MREALTSRMTSGGINVVRLHYAADPAKDPSTPVGAEWIRKALQGYPGGLDNSNWRKEMEIMYSAGGGDLVFRKFSEWRVSSSIFIQPDPEIGAAKIYGSYDHGWTNPSCYLVHAVYPGGLKRTIWEFYAPEVPVSQISRIIQGEDIVTPDGRKFDGNPYAGKEVFKVADPEIDRRTQSMHDGANKSVAKIFAENGVHFAMADRGDDMTIANWLLGNLWLDPLEPLYQICTNCKHLIWELSHLKHPKADFKRNTKEQIVDRDNHAWDALKYFLKRFPVAATRAVKPDRTNTFDWWCELAVNHAKGKPLPTFRRQMAK